MTNMLQVPTSPPRPEEVVHLIEQFTLLLKEFFPSFEELYLVTIQSFADGIYFFGEWIPNHWIMYPPFIYCWLD